MEGYICDKCGESEQIVTDGSREPTTISTPEVGFDYHLCKDCYHTFQTWLGGRVAVSKNVFCMDDDRGPSLEELSREDLQLIIDSLL